MNAEVNYFIIKNWASVFDIKILNLIALLRSL
ncbi:hypothetical protein MgSA37_01618 [Mucilaginibacter gotjawali]|uniref:Uncharacterized protein n=2 Tax=Mucilaginibacter gotjawali TaxID=1550579 RepID=A0A0X8X0K7_9SPHI|nr:hypothetical protein [Mucilaginibacter gotjawali]BAU53450.1 hypothetical protein MgSA37_01618 [Mucilaginibacter gotjawali]